ncbi:hypothetical protein [Streptomyces sp. cg40]|uniref:acyl-CoA-like ligand-binding transcription factor n=1 Tax=Streptomyces sp. cg40 TaxID=3419764 RepID=UPI003D07D7CB
MRAVWLQTHDDAEPLFAQLIADRYELSADDVRVKAGAVMLNGSLWAAAEHFTEHHIPGEDVVDGLQRALRSALTTAAQGLPD